MKYEEIKDLKRKDLIKKLSQLRKELFDSRMKLKMQRLNNPLSIRILRRNMARVQTVLSKQKNNLLKSDKGSW